MGTISGPRVALLAVALVGTLAGCGQEPAPTASSPATTTGAVCAPQTEPIAEPTEFTAYGHTKTQQVPPGPLVIEPVDPEVVGQPPFRDVIDGLPVQGMHYASGLTEAVYAAKPVDGVMPNVFVGDGGLTLNVSDFSGAVSPVELAHQEFQDRVTFVQIGPYAGYVRWDDPNPWGQRSHYVVWRGGGIEDYALYGLRSPEDLVTIARSIVCD